MYPPEKNLATARELYLCLYYVIIKEALFPPYTLSQFSHPRISFTVHVRELKPRTLAQILDKQWGGLALMMLNEGIKVYGFLFKLSRYIIIACFCTNDFIHYSYAVRSKNQPNDCQKMHKIYIPCGLDVNYLLYLLCWISIILTFPFLKKNFQGLHPLLMKARSRPKITPWGHSPPHPGSYWHL